MSEYDGEPQQLTDGTLSPDPWGDIPVPVVAPEAGPRKGRNRKAASASRTPADPSPDDAVPADATEKHSGRASRRQKKAAKAAELEAARAASALEALPPARSPLKPHAAEGLAHDPFDAPLAEPSPLTEDHVEPSTAPSDFAPESFASEVAATSREMEVLPDTQQLDVVGESIIDWDLDFEVDSDEDDIDDPPPPPPYDLSADFDGGDQKPPGRDGVMPLPGFDRSADLLDLADTVGWPGTKERHAMRATSDASGHARGADIGGPAVGTLLLERPTVAATVDTAIVETATEPVVAPAPAATPEKLEAPRRSYRGPIAVGAVLLALGIVGIGYGVFNLFISNFLADRAQAGLSTEFDSRKDLAAAGQLEDVFDPDNLPPDEALPDPAEYSETDNPVIGSIDTPYTPSDVVRDPGWKAENPPAKGEPVGRIVIPQIGVDWTVVYGVGVAELRKGPGMMPRTPVPGQYGNAVISGHRTTYGAPFGRIDELVVGDRFTVETLVGSHTYEVVATAVVSPTDTWVVQPREGSWLTLTTCHPEFSARERLIVWSKLVEGPNLDLVTTYYGTEYPVPQPPGA